MFPWALAVLWVLCAATSTTEKCTVPADQQSLVTELQRSMLSSVVPQSPPNPSILIALNLAGAQDDTKEKLLVQQIKDRVTKEGTAEMTSGEVALYILALLSSCEDPKHATADINLVEVLKLKTKEELAYLSDHSTPKTTFYQLSLDTLALCLEGASVDEAALSLAKEALAKDFSVGGAGQDLATHPRGAGKAPTAYPQGHGDQHCQYIQHWLGSSGAQCHFGALSLRGLELLTDASQGAHRALPGSLQQPHGCCPDPPFPRGQNLPECDQPQLLIRPREKNCSVGGFPGCHGGIHHHQPPQGATLHLHHPRERTQRLCAALHPASGSAEQSTGLQLRNRADILGPHGGLHQWPCCQLQRQDLLAVLQWHTASGSRCRQLHTK